MATGLLALSRKPQGTPKHEETDDTDEADKRRLTTQTIEALIAEDPAKKKKETKHWLLDSRPFNCAVYGTILCNSIQMGAATDDPDWWGWEIFEHLFTGLFLIEMFTKWFFMERDRWEDGLKRFIPKIHTSVYWKDGWNRMDCFLVCMSVLDNWIVAPASSGDGSAMSQLSVLRVIRILRIARMARLLKVFKELFIILIGILDSLRTMFWVSLLLLLTLYVCSILCVDIMGRGPDKDGNLIYEGYDDNPDAIEAAKSVANWNNYVYFGTMMRSMYTLFNIVILAEFPEIGRPMIEKQPGMIVFFVFFIVFTTFGVLNVIIGVIVDNTMEAAKSMEKDYAEREKKQKLTLLTRIRDMVFALDKDDSGSISVEEIEEGWQEPQLRELLADINLPKGWQPHELMSLLDADGDGELTFEEFMRSFYRLIASDSFQQSCCMHASLNEVKASVNRVKEAHEQSSTELKEQVTSMEQKMEKRLASMEAMMTRFVQGGGPSNAVNGSSVRSSSQPRSSQQVSGAAMGLLRTSNSGPTVRPSSGYETGSQKPPVATAGRSGGLDLRQAARQNPSPPGTIPPVPDGKKPVFLDC